jgi:prepilin-type N-terminal cleavage/methylation domain-containing protein
MPHPTNQPRGLSLIEMLVASLILLILISLVLVGLNRSRESARAMVCLSNLRGLGFATAGYSQSHNDLLPFATEVVDVQSGDIAPLDVLAGELGIDPPRLALGEVRIQPSFTCPSDQVRAARFGTNYRYIPADFMRINVWTGHPQLGVSRMYLQSTEDLPLFADIDMVHGSSHRRESRQSVMFSQAVRRDAPGPR